MSSRTALVVVAATMLAAPCLSQVPGDADGNGVLDIADAIGIVAEIHDGDGADPADALYASYPGTLDADANQDGAIDAADVSAATELLYGGALIFFQTTTYIVDEGDTSVTITVELDRAAEHPITLTYATSDGSATAGSDYNATSGPLTFTTGVVAQTFSVTIREDGDTEGTEYLNLILTNASGGVIARSGQATLSIVDAGESPLQVDAVAPGSIVEGGVVRIYARALASLSTVDLLLHHNLHGDVVLEDVPVTNDAWVAVRLPGAVVAEGTPWSVALELAPGLATPTIEGLTVMSAGSAETPLLVADEEEMTCGNECAHPILTGQTWQGAWAAAGDNDRFSFSAGAGTTVHLTLDRVDDTLPPDHPDVPTLELVLVGPDDLVVAIAPLPGFAAAGTALTATLPTAGTYTATVTSNKTTADYATLGDYQIALDLQVEGDANTFTLAQEAQRALVTTGSEPVAELAASVLDPFGHPASGVAVEWVEVGQPSGTNVPTGTDGVSRTTLSLGATGTADYEAHITNVPFLAGSKRVVNPARGPVARVGSGVRTGGLRAAFDLPDDLQQALAVRGQGDFPGCFAHEAACGLAQAGTYHVQGYNVGTGWWVQDANVTVLRSGLPITALDEAGLAIGDQVTLTPRVDLTRTDGGTTDVLENVVGLPVLVEVQGGNGGAISSDSGTTWCTAAVLPSGTPFLYRLPDLALSAATDEYLATEEVALTMTLKAEVDVGGSSEIHQVPARADIRVAPRETAPCSFLSYLDESAAVAGWGLQGGHPAGQRIGTAWLLDSCGNPVRGWGDPLTITGVMSTPPPPNGSVSASVVHDTTALAYDLWLQSTSTSGSAYLLPDANYELAYEIATTCAAASSPLEGTTSVVVDNSAPVVVLMDDGSWRADDDGYTYPMAVAPGMPLRNPVSGDIATWRIEPRLADEYYATSHTVRFGTSSWCNAPPVPVRAFVARGSVDVATGEITSDLEPIDNTVLCTGSAWFHPEYQASGPQGVILSSCSTGHSGVASLADTFTPNTTWQTPYPWATADAIGGYAVGVTSAPREPGGYLLVVEPTANAGAYDFLRDGAWRNIPWADEWKGQIAVPFEVLGGAFLDADYQVVTDTLYVSDPVTAYVRVEMEDPGTTFPANIVYEESGAVVSTTPVTLDRVGTVAGRYGVFQGEIELVAATRLHRGVLAPPGAPNHSRTPQIAVGMDGFLRAYQSSKAVGPPLAEAHTSTLEVSVTNIVFNHAAGSLTGDAIELRKDYATALPRPEYTRGGDSYAAYVGGTTPVTVQVRFEVVSPDPVDSVTVHAFSDDGPDGGTLSKTDQKVISFMNGVSQEGTDDPATPWDDSEYVTFTLANPIPSQISRSDERWIWQVDELNENPVDHLFSADASGPHHTYVLYAAPEAPWTQTVDEPHNPWVSLLDLACDWAQGTPSSGIAEPLEEQRAIVNALIPGAYEGMANTGKTYDPAESHCNGATGCDLTAIVSPSAVGNRTLDCFDASGLVVLSGRAIGVADVSRNKVFGTFWLGAKFVTQPVMPFRLEPNAVLCPSGSCWRIYFFLEHSFAWFDNRVFDGMIKVNEDDPRYPRDEPCAGVECAGSYRDDVLAPGSEWELFGFEDITEFH